uniref:Ig-like domain-containing protein n=1 Tax=Dicentrarchus labrax TaxID=13489 RepID=A0A8P4KDL2_DICLA
MLAAHSQLIFNIQCLEKFELLKPLERNENCAEKPVFSPSRLVVKFGDPSSTMCTVCEQCTAVFGLEKSLGKNIVKGTTITWKADSVTEWELPLMCYYDNNYTQCCSRLPVTVYKPPDNVSISFVNHTGPMYEGRQYSLQCTVQGVAPVGNLTVTFHKGHTILGQLKSNNTTRKPVTEIFTLNITSSKYDDGVHYWCESKLELGPEGPQPPPVVKSQNITANVYCEQIPCMCKNLLGNKLNSDSDGRRL